MAAHMAARMVPLILHLGLIQTEPSRITDLVQLVCGLFTEGITIFRTYWDT